MSKNLEEITVELFELAIDKGWTHDQMIRRVITLLTCVQADSIRIEEDYTMEKTIHGLGLYLKKTFEELSVSIPVFYLKNNQENKDKQNEE